MKMLSYHVWIPIMGILIPGKTVFVLKKGSDGFIQNDKKKKKDYGKSHGNLRV